jgi:cytidylate kinase
MGAITISRELGSGGASIARLVAAELRYHLLDRELVDAVAARAGVGQAAAEALDERGLDWAGGLVDSILHALQGQLLTQESYGYLATRLIQEAAANDKVVILGRGGQVALGFRPGTFHVHVFAPERDRVVRIAARDHISPSEAEAKVHDSDAERGRYVHSVSRRDWHDPALYDLLINTHRLSPEAGAGLVVEAARAAGVVS